MPKITALPTGTPKLTDVVPGVDKTASATDQYTWQSVLAMLLGGIYPVGYVLTNTSGNSPATELGFGTWVQYAKGRVLVGQDSTQVEFDTAEETGGEKTHILTTGEMPSHSHSVSDPGHSHGSGANYFMDAGGAGNLGLNTPGNRFAQGLSPLYINGSGTGIWINSTGSDQAHNNLQPYQVVYFWKRTA